MVLAWQVEHWKTVADFEAHLVRHDPAICAWAVGVTVHHTYRPLPEQWAGAHTMQGLHDYYAGKGWSGAPHLFIAPDGIWQATPLNLSGIHAGDCNSDHWGMEVVGDYDREPWQEPIGSLARGAITALYRWRGLTDASTLLGHRECLPNKSCPGSAINMGALRDWLKSELRPAAPPTPPTPPADRYTEHSPLLGTGRATLEQVVTYLSHDNYTEQDIRDHIAAPLIALCAAAYLNHDLLAAQLAHETGRLTSWWCQRPRRNPAGIGVTGRRERQKPAAGAWAFRDGWWYEGVSFATWKDYAIPAFVGRVLAYALRDDQASELQRWLIAAALQARPLPVVLRGSVTVLRELGAAHNRTGQGWAYPGAEYGQRIAEHANAMRGI